MFSERYLIEAVYAYFDRTSSGTEYGQVDLATEAEV